MKHRDPKYDIMKGIGIVLVVLGHSGMALGHYIIYLFHMPLFFFVSGRLHKPKDVTKGIKSKFVSMAVPFIIFFALCTAIDYFIFADDPNFHINSVYPYCSAGPLWFLYAMLWVYIIYLVLDKYIPKFVLPICVAISLFGYFLSLNEISLPLFLDSAFSCLIFYAVGRHTVKYSFKANFWVKCIVIVCLLLFLWFLYLIDFKVLHLGGNDLHSNTMMHNYGLFIISAFVGIAFIEVVSDLVLDFKRIKIDTVLIKLGELSLYVFALHLLIINLFKLGLNEKAVYYYPTIIIGSLTISMVFGSVLNPHINKLIKAINSKW